MPKQAFLRWTGAALMLGGFLTVVINAVLTPAMATDVPFTQTAASTVFLWRQSASAAAAAMLLFGSLGLYLAQDQRPGYFGGISFTLAFLGSALLLAWEWVDVFVLRELALRAPAALQTLEDEQQLTLYDLGALIPISIFATGWIALSVWTLQGRVLSRRAAAMVIAGFFLTPLLTAVLPGMWGGAVGSAVLGFGLMWLGYEVRKI
jgi:hypothetical protein